MTNKKRFTMIDEEFVCDVCGKTVKPLNYTARNHCPYCLHSKHLDINPGDRTSTCHGILKPIAIEPWKKDTQKIVFKCLKCGEIKRNIVATDDNFDLILKLMSNPEK